MKVARTACMFDDENQDGDSQRVVADLRCYSVYRDSRHLGLIRRLF